MSGQEDDTSSGLQHRSGVRPRLSGAGSVGEALVDFQGRKINLGHVFAGQNVGITQVGERIWLVTFMHYDWGDFDDETCRLEPIQNPFGPKVLPMSPE